MTPLDDVANVNAFAEQAFVEKTPLQVGDIFVCQVVVHGRQPAPSTIILIVKVDSPWDSYGSKHPLGREGMVGTRRERDRIELFRDDEVWATYDVTAKPFTESVTIGANEYSLAAGRVLLIDCTAQPRDVEQVDTDVREFAQQPDFGTTEDVRLWLKKTLDTLATRDQIVRRFITATNDSH